ncbi:MAG: response regulator, partial [Oscillospiraceae bacterium]|nr:response regulator [Oscillospiraceae bacterium]
MFRVILIDDEPLIVEGLKKVVRWEEYQCTVVATAEDAEKGAELIRTLQPDILFTDIRMPGVDGLTMLAGLRSEFPELQVTVLTGYRDFSYAQEAIKLGVARFLLKPSKMDEIREALACMTARLEQRHPEQDAEPAEKDEEKENAGSFLVNRALDYLEEHYAEK